MATTECEAPITGIEMNPCGRETSRSHDLHRSTIGVTVGESEIAREITGVPDRFFDEVCGRVDLRRHLFGGDRSEVRVVVRVIRDPEEWILMDLERQCSFGCRFEPLADYEESRGDPFFPKRREDRGRRLGIRPVVEGHRDHEPEGALVWRRFLFA